MYDEEKAMWNKVADLPTEREDCTCCLLPTGKIFVAGGEEGKGQTSRVDVATVLNYSETQLFQTPEMQTPRFTRHFSQVWIAFSLTALCYNH